MDARIWTLALNTLLLASAACAISLPLGTGLGWLLTRTDLPGRRLGMALLGLMLFVPLYLQTAAWQAGFGIAGWCTRVMGLPVWLDGWTGAIWVHSMAAVPWVALIVGLGVRLMEPELEEQALLDGSSWQVFFRITLRGTLPAAAVAALWVILVTAGEMTATDLFVVRTYAEELYTRLAIGPELDDAPLGVLGGATLIVVLMVAGMVLCTKLAPHDRPISFQRRWVFPLGRWRIPLAGVTCLLLLLLIGVPLFNLCYKSGVLIELTDAEPLRSWSLGKCLAIVAASPMHYRREFGWSLLIGTLAATAAVLAAIPAAWLARRGKLRAVPALVVAAVCLALPGPLIGLVIIRLLNRPEVPLLVELYDRSILAPWLALVVRSLPLAVLVLWHAFRTVPEEMLESAAADGAGPLRRLCTIALPVRFSAVVLAWVVALAVALGDLAASILVVPPGVTTLSIQIFDLLHSGVEDQVAGISLALIVFFGAVTAIAAWLAIRRDRYAGE